MFINTFINYDCPFVFSFTFLCFFFSIFLAKYSQENQIELKHSTSCFSAHPNVCNTRLRLDFAKLVLYGGVWPFELVANDWSYPINPNFSKPIGKIRLDATVANGSLHFLIKVYIPEAVSPNRTLLRKWFFDLKVNENDFLVSNFDKNLNWAVLYRKKQTKNRGSQRISNF